MAQKPPNASGVIAASHPPLSIMATCPFCQRGALRIIAAITQEAVITRVLRHLKLAAVPPPIAPARSRQETFDWVA
jgi:hypothetical protein